MTLSILHDLKLKGIILRFIPHFPFFFSYSQWQEEFNFN